MAQYLSAVKASEIAGVSQQTIKELLKQAR